MNRHDPNFVFCFGLDASSVPVIDIRSPAVPIAMLSGHTGVSCAQWAPNSAAHLMISDQTGLAIWDLKGNLERASWFYETKPGACPVQFVWSTLHPDHVAFTTSDQVVVTKI